MYKTVYQEAEAVDIVKKSRFIAYVKPVDSVEEAQKFIEEIKKKHWDASHNVPCYVIGDRMQVQKFSDDGEPSGTAGLPILNLLKHENISNVVIVVTRYFGGTKLGTGGLVRAYGHAAKLGLEAGRIIEMLAYTELHISMNYTLHGKFQNFLMQNPQHLIISTDYTDQVLTKLYIKEALVEGFHNKIVDMTHDQCHIKTLDTVVLPISNGEWIGGNDGK